MALTALLKPTPRLPITRVIQRTLSQSTRMASTHRSLSTYVVHPPELHAALSNPPPEPSRIIPLCASWFMPNSPLTGPSVFARSRLPSARFFDLDTIKDPHSPYPHMLPSATDFAAAMSGLGITPQDTLVVYDSAEQGLFSAPRVGWTLRVFGHPHVHLLDNFKTWVAQGYPVDDGAPDESFEKTAYPVPELDAEKVVSFDEMRDIALAATASPNDAQIQILDARGQGRWAGIDPEPRPGLSSGHIPSSLSVPVLDLLDPETRMLLPAAKLREVFAAKGVDPSRPIISSCGTGVTAAVIDAALEVAGYGDDSGHGKRRLFDGSWT
ncbi:MAG: hypothetical protein M1819_003416 [Sarea resinae]|nr:MAG: hypothetical protein M1819_003416 [Sarea resinae]